MTKSECWNEISRNEQLIEQYQADIARKEQEIKELTTTKTKVQGAASQLSGCRSQSSIGLAGYSKISRINERFLNRFYDGMNDLLNGGAYNKVAQGLENAVTSVTNEIEKKQREIAQLQNNIVSCRNTIQQMHAEIARIEEEERRAAAEAAAREAAAREAAARAAAAQNTRKSN